MTCAIRHGRRWLLAGCVAAALGFGTGQALAAPDAGKAAARCDPERCDANCKRSIPGSTGVCVGGRFCDCLLGP